MKMIVASVSFALLFLSITVLTTDRVSNKAMAQEEEVPIADDEVSDWWGHCNLPPGMVCARCVAPGCGGSGPGGRPIPVGGSAGCTGNPGIARGDDCNGWTGICTWHTALCGNQENPDCVYNVVTTTWDPACVMQPDGCPGC